ncbi:MAG: hypothetical protein WCP62_13550, partial [Planctomycetota bacterium]
KCPLGDTDITTASSLASPVKVIEFPLLAIEKASGRRPSRPSSTNALRNALLARFRFTVICLSIATALLANDRSIFNVCESRIFYGVLKVTANGDS